MKNKIFKIAMIVVAIIAVTVSTDKVYAFSIGSTGESVKDLQITLIEAGYDIPAITSGGASFGYFGVQTKAALERYEADNASSLTLGAAASATDFQKHAFFNRGVTMGGRVATTSTATAYTTSALDFSNTPSVILWTPNRDTTISLSGTSTFAYIPNIGDVASVYLLNASTTATSAITFAAKDSGVDLQFTEATGGDLVLNGLDWAKLIFIRQAANKVSIIFDEFTEAD